MRFLLAHDEVRREMGWKAREYARKFSWDNISSVYERYLTSVLQEK
jgi:hypothetical protein